MQWELSRQGSCSPFSTVFSSFHLDSLHAGSQILCESSPGLPAGSTILTKPAICRGPKGSELCTYLEFPAITMTQQQHCFRMESSSQRLRKSGSRESSTTTAFPGMRSDLA